MTTNALQTQNEGPATGMTKSNNEVQTEVQTNGAAAKAQATLPVFRPAVDIRETEDAILLTADMPGVSESNVDVTVERDVLTFRGMVEAPRFDGDHFDLVEYRIGHYQRSFTISNDIDRGGIEASMRHGVLRITLPKAKHAMRTRVSVKAG